MRRWARALSPGRIVIGTLLAVALPSSVALAVSTWWLPDHVRKVTGRTDVPRVSCLHCHASTTAPPTPLEAPPSGYLSPTGIAISADGGRLFVAASEADRLLEVDTRVGAVRRTVKVDGHPHGVALSPDGSMLAVSRRHADRVQILDTEQLRPVTAIEDVPGPLGVTFSADGDRLYVTAGASDELLLFDVRSPTAPRRMPAGNEPYDVATSRDGSLVALSNRLAREESSRTAPLSEITLLTPTSLSRRYLESGHLSEGVAAAADGSFVLAPYIKVRNLLPITQVARGAVMSGAIAVIDPTPGGMTVGMPLDEMNEYWADPSDIVLTPDGTLAFIALSGARAVAVIDVPALLEAARAHADDAVDPADDLALSSRYVIARVPTRDNPRNLVVSPDGRRLYVAERLADSIAVIDIEHLQVIDRIELGGPDELTLERKGAIVFHDASFTFQGQFSCRSCHPDGATDGLIWDFDIDGVGRNLLETRSLRGIRDTAPFKWNGKNPDLQTQCGPRFAMVLTRTDPIPPAELDALVAFIESLPTKVRRVTETMRPAVERGREIFFRSRTNSGEAIAVADRCDTCHRPPLYTDRLPADVGTGGRFDTPHLFDIGSSAPYLHDGRARTLEEIWTVHSPDDSHGITNDLTKAELNDLLVFLRSL